MKLKLSIFLLAAVCFLTVSANAQVRFKIPIYLADSLFLGGDSPLDTTVQMTFMNVINRDTIWFGFHDSATVCRDTLRTFTTHWTLGDTGMVTEDLYPPDPPSKRVFKLQQIDSRQGCFTDGSKFDIRKYAGGFLRDSLKFKVGAEDNQDIFLFHRETLTWPPALAQYFDSCWLRNIAGPQPLNVDMKRESKARGLLFSAADITNGHSYRITVINPKAVPSVPTVTLLTPADGAIDITLNPTLTWSPAAGALYYRIQVSKNDPNFGAANLIANDSLGSGTTSKALINLTGGTNYYWRVAVFTVGGVSFFQTPPFKFTTLVLTLQTVCDLPVNGATGVATNPTLTWHPIPNNTGATNYHVQVATDSNFTGLIVNDSTLVSPSRAVAVQNCLRYYWRARTKNTTGWGPFSNQLPTNPHPTFSFRVTLATPSTPVLVSPADGATGISSPALLSWQNDACGDSALIQVTSDTSGSPIFRYYQTVPGSSVSVPGLLQGATLYWRATAVNGLPSSSSPSAYRSFTTLLLPPATPTLQFPSDLDSNVSLSPTLSWNSIQYADTYTLKVYKDAAFTIKVYDDSTLSGIPSQTLSGLENCTRYYWKVKAKNTAGSSAFSPVRSFKTIKAPPGASTLITPSNGQTQVAFTPRLIWSRPDVCTDYFIITLKLDTSLAAVVSRDSTTDTTIVVGPLIALTDYFWKVEPYNAFQGKGSYNWSRFKVTDQTPPEIPLLTYPSNGQDGLPANFTLRWDSAAKASTYRVQVSLDSLFTLLLVNDSTVAQSPTPGKAIGPLLNSRTYWWRVNAKNVKGTSLFSEVWTFRTLSPPSAPTLIAPYYGATNVPVSPTFVWTIPDRADSYRLQVAKDVGFVQKVRDDSNIVNTNWTVAGLQGIRTYYWRVFGKNSVGYGDTSQIFVFTTERLGAADWAIPISICETGPACDTLELGIDPSASYGIDYPLGEYELPQPPPSGWFDVRFVDSRPVSEIGEGLRVNAHPFRSYGQIDTFKIKFQPGLGTYPMLLSWNSAFISTICDSMVMKDEYTGAIVHQRMDLASSVSTGLSSILIIEYGAFPLPVGVKPPPAREVPKGFVLSQNYPNPFNPTTRIDFSTEKPAFVTVAVYDVLGREVSQLVNETFQPGLHHAEWNGSNKDGHAMPSGVYYVRMLARPSQDEGAPFSAVRKIIMMK